MLKENLPNDPPIVFISAVAQQGLQQLKDLLWEEMNSESNKLAAITTQDTVVHKNKDFSHLSDFIDDDDEGWGDEEGYMEDEDIEYLDEDDFEDLEDFEYEDTPENK